MNTTSLAGIDTHMTSNTTLQQITRKNKQNQFKKSYENSVGRAVASFGNIGAGKSAVFITLVSEGEGITKEDYTLKMTNSSNLRKIIGFSLFISVLILTVVLKSNFFLGLLGGSFFLTPFILDKAGHNKRG
ncbi:hypothetical protein FOZ71_07390 [Weissella cibaria]|uniref:hypothetical protein n=1 Tax=Weissella cibaria TaxID=137591 RepID=UPI001191FAAC|nr:hypothetical protein [Weissella cibaria]TVV29934.1 hypothetical protein FOZ71_07390 [Weissella cibaria]